MTAPDADHNESSATSQRESKSVAKPQVNWSAYAEHLIRQAQQAGKFDNLPGFGKPIPSLDEPWDENEWARRKLQSEQVQVLPPALAIRVDAERTLARLHELADEEEVRRELSALNDRIRKAHFSPAPGPPNTTTPVDIDATLADWRAARHGSR